MTSDDFPISFDEDPAMHLFALGLATTIVTGRHPNLKAIEDTNDFQIALRDHLAAYLEDVDDIATVERVEAMRDVLDIYIGATRHRQREYREMGRRIDDILKDPDTD